ncbi:MULTISPECIES: fimbrial biogenesis chaperone [Providencia]|uniref:Molecular chaperone n=1 Tax=Providencia rettgeri TaxID=587 RepID=A0AAJ6FRC4_PRORE|nr:MULTISPECIES: molecular chaperone [Providencia]WHT81758.1 molecular chaperone [Providencia rettgeri]WHT95907.1 molecular chaperone [Providencia rettgeri]WJM88272.1 molecular chaperone [Providencia rettgeri]
MKFFLCALLFINFISVSNAGVIIGGTRVIYNEGSNSVSIGVENPDEVPYLIQSWIDNIDNKKQSDFTITPPLFRLNGEQSNALRIFLTNNQLPSDRESLFWLNIKTIPASKRMENSLQIAFKTQMKLIYRPVSLKNIDFIKEQKKLKWSKYNNELIVNNPTAYFMNFQQISFNGNKVEDVTYVAPFSTKRFKIQSNKSNGKVIWNIINDFGAITDTEQTDI